jgi:hypothetical protein
MNGAPPTNCSVKTVVRNNGCYLFPRPHRAVSLLGDVKQRELIRVQLSGDALALAA